MQLHHFPSPNPQKITFALKELGLDCEIVPVDLAKGEHRQTAFLALDPLGRVPVLVDGDLVLPKSHAVLAYLGENCPASRHRQRAAPRRSDGCSSRRSTSPPAGEVELRFRAKLFGRPVEKPTVKRGEEALPPGLAILEDHLVHKIG